MRSKTLGQTLAAGTAILLLAACGGTGTGAGDSADGDNYGIVPIYTPRQGGTAYIVGGGIANLISEHVDGAQASVEATTGTLEMVQRLDERMQSGDPAFTLMDTAGTLWAFEGQAPYEQEYTELRALTFAGNSDLYMVTRADSGIESYADLEGKTIGIGGPGSPTNLLTVEVLVAHGVEEGEYTGEFLGYEDVVDGLSNGSIDAGVLAGSPPVSAYAELATQQDVRIVPVDEQIADQLVKERPYFYRGVVEAGQYPGVEAEIPVMGFGTNFVTHSETPDDLVRQVMEVIFDNHDALVSVHGSASEMTLENANRAIGIPFHPAAEEYLSEQGVNVGGQ
ncbi:TAXI family TRAP transporter solute-binding subunit [Georgenia sp. EYE_87]|uniref:TAXI family TRAP transporter solute-binding subunit n=1 Tax=Georgenia sp. EYE_87 TaxID=2853448 RepID=UPI002005063A|nr:TAXI family TRAP transporter solute-binding subunit [Georgenia sp. EYE_87]MCK6210540.1 TAXI family TRAP transporter solute-binding subunit [Georgenia sp. EYE_87]